MKRRLILTLLPLLLAACSSPNGAAVSGTTVTLHVGELGRIAGRYSLKFDRVAEDSRCPTGLECFWAGNAVVAITYIATDGREVPFTLETYDEVKHDTVIDGHTIHLNAVAPYPEAERTISEGEYAVTVTAY